MARGKINKSAKIREIHAQNPKAKTKEIVEILGQKGLSVHPNLVYLVLSKMRGRKRRQKRLQAIENSRKAGVTNPVELILRVRSVAMEAGGIRKLKALVDALAE